MASMTRIAVAALLALALHGPAHADPQIRIYMSTATTGSMYPLKPGLYGGGTIHGALHPRAEFLRITSVSDASFQGTLEIARIDPDGHLLNVKGRIEGTITPRPQNVPYIDITVLDDPLHALMGGMHGPIVSTGLGMSWSGAAPSTGDSPYGANDRLVPMSEQRYAQLLAGFQQIADTKVQSISEQEASIPVVEKRISDFMQLSDAWLQDKPDTYTDQALAKMKALYAEEKAIVARGSNNDPQQVQFEAMPVALEMAALISAYGHYQHARVREDVFRGSLMGTADIFDLSPCLQGTGDQVANAAAKCKELAAPVEAFKQRALAVRKQINADHAMLDRADLAMECLSDRADKLLNDSRTLPTFCPKDDDATTAQAN